MHFPTTITQIKARLSQIDPIRYASTRDYKNGALTYLSPYISRGVLSTKAVFEYIQTLGLEWYQAEKLIQELAWRDYFQQVWSAKGTAIETDLKNKQTPISNYALPEAIRQAKTEIEAVDEAIRELYQTGYMHNHMRMYVASICCNIAQSHWLQPAKWLYYHLLDGDLASNYLSWQWVAGAFANKKYYANQTNINKFFGGTQKNTFLDVQYGTFENLAIPTHLQSTLPFEPQTELPQIDKPTLDENKPTLIYNYYNLDPNWHEGADFQRVFLLEPCFFKRYPISQKCLEFALALTKNIPTIKIYVDEFSELKRQVKPNNLIYKMHPANKHYVGLGENGTFMTNVEGYFRSFFAFWKKCKKELRLRYTSN